MNAEKAAGRQKVSDDQVVQLFRDAHQPIRTAGDLTEQLPITRQAVNKRLRRLASRGLLCRRKVGSSAVVYWLPDR
ncbi:MarR family transcriptional regulator [Halobaculum limi]|uniref:MarR family transcriptional regulator n=1 Tax=Halobaculum limi TaxID=3031916 RepID=UPI003D80F976